MNFPPRFPPLPMAPAAPQQAPSQMQVGITPDGKLCEIVVSSGPLQSRIVMGVAEAETIASAILDRVRKARDEKIVLADALGREKSRLT